VPTNQAAAAISKHQTPQLAAYSYHICHRAKCRCKKLQSAGTKSCEIF